MSKYRLAIFSAFLSIVGTFLLVLSFQATSSDFMLLTANDGSGTIASYDFIHYDKHNCTDEDCPDTWGSPTIGCEAP